jgi:histidinol-phosphatase (PHP family)
VPFEINTAGKRRDCHEEYPSRQFIELAHSAGVPLLINSDAHAPHDVAAGFEDAAALAQTCGYTHTVRFSKHERSSVAFIGA